MPEMILKIIGNNNYILEIKNDIYEVKPLTPNTPEVEQREKYVKMCLYGGEPKWYEKEWLSLMSIHNLIPPKGYERCVDLFRFNKFKPIYVTVDKYIVSFSKPVEHKTMKGFRMIARYPNYFVSGDGKVYNEATKKFVTTASNSRGYNRVSIRDQSGLSVYACCSIHRLVGVTWVPNSDYVEKPIIDHIDGNRYNNNYTNLRWVTYRENALYAFTQNLKKNNVKVISKNIDTGEMEEHISIQAAFDYIGKHKFSNTAKDIVEGKVWKGKNGSFELKLKDSNREWVYETKKPEYKTMFETSKISITIDGKTSDYSNWREVKAKVLKVDPVFSYTIPMIVKKIHRIWPGSKVTFKTYNGIVGTCGDKTIETKTTQEMADKTGFSKSTIISYSKTEKPYNNWIFKRMFKETNLSKMHGN